MAAIAASKPLLPALVPARSMAWSMFLGHQHLEDHRHAGVGRRPGDPRRRLAGDVLVMVGRALDHRAERDHRIEGAGLGAATRCQPESRRRPAPSRR
jgi:hypothetical protein